MQPKLQYDVGQPAYHCFNMHMLQFLPEILNINLVILHCHKTFGSIYFVLSNECNQIYQITGLTYDTLYGNVHSVKNWTSDNTWYVTSNQKLNYTVRVQDQTKYCILQCVWDQIKHWMYDNVCTWDQTKDYMYSMTISVGSNQRLYSTVCVCSIKDKTMKICVGSNQRLFEMFVGSNQRSDT